MTSRPAFVFPGVGVALCGREPAFFAEHEGAMMPLMEEASARAGADLVACVRAGRQPGGAIPSQVFAYAFGCAVAAAHESGGAAPCMTAGYSLGLYAALAAAGAISFRDGLEITCAAHEIMKRCCPDGGYEMAAIVGLEAADVESIVARDGRSTVAIANSSGPMSKLLSGRRDEILAAVTDARAEGAFRAVTLGVDLPYHHPVFLAGATRDLGAYLGTVRWSRPRCAVVSSIDGRPISDPGGLLDLTARNISTPITWEGVMGTLIREGIDVIYECGAGVSLTQAARSMDGCPPFVNVKNAGGRAS